MEEATQKKVGKKLKQKKKKKKMMMMMMKGQQERLPPSVVSSSHGLDVAAAVVSPKKKTRSPGVRLRGRRIYDSENGTTCHQCRQKTLDFSATCKNMAGEKQCCLNFCYKCLLNRYGEKVEVVAAMEDWSCPRCRGVCNCSFCMKKRGQQPTGILVHIARSTGLSSVSEMLQLEGGIGGRAVAEEVVGVEGRDGGASSSCAGSSPDDPIVIDEGLQGRKEMALDMEIERLKLEIAQLEAAIVELEKPEAGW